MQVFNFGSVNIDMVYRVPHLVAPGETLSSVSLDTVLGGKGANQSVALAKAGCDVRHIGKLGDSDKWACDQLRSAGVDVSHIALIDGPSGHAIIQVDDKGENSIILHGGANQTFTRAELDNVLRQADEGDWLLLQNECNALDIAFELAESYKLRLAFNPAPMTASVLQLPLDRCKILVVNETEATALAKDDNLDTALSTLGARFADTRLVLTQGSKGALLQHGDKRLAAEAFKVQAVDTTGAGDTFVGYYLASLMAGLDDERALQRSCAAAALSVTQQGATTSIPATAEVEQFMR